MLHSRMGWNVDDPKMPFRSVDVYQLNSDTIVVFLLGKEKYYTVEDEAGLYPSDALITKLRLLE